MHKRILTYLALIFSSACGVEPEVKDYTEVNVGQYGDVKFLKSNVNSIVPELKLGALPAQLFNHSSPDKLGRLDAVSWQELLKTTMTTAAPEACSEVLGDLSYSLRDFASTPCFSPALTISSHPDGAEDKTLPAGRSAIWWNAANIVTNRGEACGSAVFNEVSRPHFSLIRLGIGLSAAGACLARVNKQSLPENGNSLDLKPYYLNEEKSVDLSFDSFSITDQSDSNNASFLIEAVINAAAKQIRITHSFNLGDEFKKAYEGKIGVLASTDETKFLTVRADYKVEDSENQIESFSALLSAEEADPILNLPDISDLDILANSDNQMSYLHSVEDDRATYQSLVWPGHNSSFVVNVGRVKNSENDALSLFLGYHQRNPNEKDYRLIEGMYCFPEDEVGYVSYPGVQYQKLSASSTGKYEPLDTATIFVPTNSCDIAFVKGFPGSNAGLTKVVNGPLTNNLLIRSQYLETWSKIIGLEN